MKGFENAEKVFINTVKPKNMLTEFDYSGSCANVVIIIGKGNIILWKNFICFLLFYLNFFTKIFIFFK
jgi:hypothetical protein